MNHESWLAGMENSEIFKTIERTFWSLDHDWIFKTMKRQRNIQINEFVIDCGGLAKKKSFKSSHRLYFPKIWKRSNQSCRPNVLYHLQDFVQLYTTY